MKLKVVFGCLALFTLLHIDCFSQKKKKNPYEGYWEQQEKQEKFDKIAKEGHVLFQEKKFDQAKIKYQEALKIIPTDQRAIAKIRDINLLIEKQNQLKYQEKKVVDTEEEKEVHEEVPDTLTLYLDDVTSSKTKDTLIQIKPKSEKKQLLETETKSLKPVNSKPVSKEVVTKKTENTKPYKNTENYRKYLATIYQPGWTEEQYTEGKKEIIKRVFVLEKYGEEYLLVKHHYGAVYYFKNGASISYSTWIAETEKRPK